MQPAYNPKAWFWIVGGDETRAWSSAQAAYVSEWPPDYVTPIANEVELYDVLAKRGLAARAPSRTFSTAEVRAALLRIDAAATGEARDVPSLQAVVETIGTILPPMQA